MEGSPDRGRKSRAAVIDPRRTHQCMSMRAISIPCLFVVLGCSSASSSHSGGKGDSGAAGKGGSSQHGSGGGSSESDGGPQAAGGAGGQSNHTGGSSSHAGGRTGSAGASTGTPDASTPKVDSGPPQPIVHGGPGCGLPSAAFCDTFDKVGTTKGGRAGELDHSMWSSGRLAPQLPTGNGCAIGIGPGTLPACRDGLPAQVFPDQDTLVCDPQTGTNGKHLLVVAAAQNYGQNSYRIRQPFDFAGRTGKIVFDAEGMTIGPLFGWISVEITEDPINAPCFAIGDPGTNNNEGSLVPKNAVEIELQNPCGGYSTTPAVSVSMIDVLTNYQDTLLMPKAPPVCVATERNKLNHFEISISQKHIEVNATPFSMDGTSFPAPQVLYSTDANIPFSRGWVQISTHNHATLKYSGPGSGFGSEEKLDSWTSRWDNVGFDGPVLSNYREYEIPDSLTSGQNAWNRMGPIKNVGYLVGDAADAPKNTLHFNGVDLSNVTAARLSLSSWYLNQGDKPASTFTLRYRFNGKAWHDRTFTDGELALITGTHSQGQLGQMLDVPVADLVQGDNSLEFVTVNVPQNYPPVVANIDLVLTTK